MPPHKNQVNFCPSTDDSTRTQKPSQFLSLHRGQVNFDHHSRIKSIWMPRHQKQVNFDPYNSIKSISTPTVKPSQFRSLHRNQLKFYPSHKPSKFRSKHRWSWYACEGRLPLERPPIHRGGGHPAVFTPQRRLCCSLTACHGPRERASI